MTVWNDSEFTNRLVHANWMAHTSVLMYLNERATGDPARDWLSSWALRYFVGDDLRVLVLGCGEGWLERAVAQWPFVARIDAVDFAADAVARAKEAARGIAKIEYGVVDLNRDELPRDTYDVVVAHSVLHHVENLEHAYAQIEGAMRADATLVVNEYVGPDRFQFSDNVLRIMNALIDCVRPGEFRTRPTIEEMIANDPTEAVRAEELLAFTAQHFEILEQKSLGGTILQHLLYNIVQHYHFEVPRERGLIEMLCAIEGMLIDRGRIPSDFTILAARKKGSKVRATNRPLPARPEAAKDVDKDPLCVAQTLLSVRPRAEAPAQTRVSVLHQTRVSVLHQTGVSVPHIEKAWQPAFRCLRIALASQQPHRANLFASRRLYEWRERFLARGRDPWEWVLRRMPDDPPFVRLVETAATLAAE